MEEVQRSHAIDIDVFLHGRRVSGGERGKVIADACVGDDKVEGGDSLVLDRGHGIGGVGGRFAVNLADDQLPGGVFGEGGEPRRGGVVGVADGGYDDGGGSSEVGLHEAEADACM